MFTPDISVGYMGICMSLKKATHWMKNFRKELRQLNLEEEEN